MNIRRILTGVCILVFVVAISGCSKASQSDGDNETENQNVTVSQSESSSQEETQAQVDSIEEITIFQTLDTVDLDGNSITTESLSTVKLNVINVWASWCGPCVAEIPEIEKVWQEIQSGGEVAIYGMPLEFDASTGLILKGLSSTEESVIKDLMDENSVTYSQILANEEMIEQLLLITGFPTTFFVDQEGNLVGKPMIGAASARQWKMEIEDRLEMLKND